MVRYGENYSERAFGDRSGLLDCLDPIYVLRPQHENFQGIIAFEIFYGGIGIRKGEIRNGNAGISCKLSAENGGILLE